jgi:hypothetical protein
MPKKEYMHRSHRSKYSYGVESGGKMQKEEKAEKESHEEDVKESPSEEMKEHSKMGMMKGMRKKKNPY